MKQDWQDKVAACEAMLDQALGAPDARLRCMARLGKAITMPINEWYADELARGTDPAVMLQALTVALGQILGIQLHNAGGAPPLVDSALRLLALQTGQTLAQAQAGAFDGITVRKSAAGT